MIIDENNVSTITPSYTQNPNKVEAKSQKIPSQAQVHEISSDSDSPGGRKGQSAANSKILAYSRNQGQEAGKRVREQGRPPTQEPMLQKIFLPNS